MKDILKKVCIVGDPGVGKSCLIKRFADDTFSDKYTHTTGTKMSKKEMEFPDIDVRLSMQLWDVVGPKSPSFLEGYIQGAAGVMAVCDVSRDETLSNLDEWLASVRHIAPDVPVVILANKSDMTDEAVVDSQSVAIAARRFKAPYYMTSARTGVNVALSFGAIGRMVLGEAPLAV
jgi:Ras-related protein Rab-1A